MKKSDQHYDVPVEDVDPVDLPENAFVELGKDEEYRPVMHPAREYKEVTVYSEIGRASCRERVSSPV